MLINEEIKQIRVEIKLPNIIGILDSDQKR